MSVALLLPGSVVAPAGAATVAVLVRRAGGRRADGAMTVKVTVPPRGRVTVVVDVAGAAGGGARCAPPVPTAVQVTAVMAGGKRVGDAWRRVTVLGPALLTTMV